MIYSVDCIMNCIVLIETLCEEVRLSFRQEIC